MGHGRALPRARPLRPALRGAVRRHGDGRADGARRDRGAVQGLRDDGPDHGRAGARLAGHQAGRDGRAEGALPAEARERRVARGLRADRAGLGLGLGGDAHRGAARRRRVRPQRRQALHHERGRRGALRRLREDRSGGRPLGDLRVRRRGRHAGLRGGADRAEDGHQGLDDRRDLLQRHARSRRQPARRGGRGIQDRDADPRPLTARESPRRGSGSRRARRTMRSSTRARARRWASRSPSTR